MPAPPPNALRRANLGAGDTVTGDATPLFPAAKPVGNGQTIRRWLEERLEGARLDQDRRHRLWLAELDMFDGGVNAICGNGAENPQAQPGILKGWNPAASSFETTLPSASASTLFEDRQVPLYADSARKIVPQPLHQDPPLSAMKPSPGLCVPEVVPSGEGCLACGGLGCSLCAASKVPGNAPEEDAMVTATPSNDRTPKTWIPSESQKLKFTEAYRQEMVETIQNSFNLGRLEFFVRGDTFEALFGVFILLNTIFMAVVAQYEGIKVAASMDHPAYIFGTQEIWPGAPSYFESIDIFFGALFSVELVLKFVCLRLDFFPDRWNWLDFLIVISWLMTRDTSVDFPINPMLIRLARLARLLRLARLIRTIQAFDALFLMTTAMQGSLSALIWTAVLLVLVLMMCGLFIQMMVTDYIGDTAVELARREQVFQFYGTFARSMLTMFEITMGNWMPPCRALVENQSEFWMLFFVAHKLLIGFSVLAVINGVFIQETFKVATHDDRILIMQKRRAERIHVQKMSALLHHADQDGDAAISRDEFAELMDDEDVRAWLAGMGLRVKDVDTVFQLLDEKGNKDGRLTVPELVSGVAELKGEARSIDVVLVQRELRELAEVVQKLSEKL